MKKQIVKKICSAAGIGLLLSIPVGLTIFITDLTIERGINESFESGTQIKPERDLFEKGLLDCAIVTCSALLVVGGAAGMRTEETAEESKPQLLKTARHNQVYFKGTSCNGCKNWYGKIHGGQLLVCAIHPSGPDSSACVDKEI
jgi:hypothetical protein